MAHSKGGLESHSASEISIKSKSQNWMGLLSLGRTSLSMILQMSSASAIIALSDSTSLSAAHNSSWRPAMRPNCCSLIKALSLERETLSGLRLQFSVQLDTDLTRLLIYSSATLEKHGMEWHCDNELQLFLNWSNDWKFNFTPWALVAACHRLCVPTALSEFSDIKSLLRLCPDDRVNKRMVKDIFDFKCSGYGS